MTLLVPSREMSARRAMRWPISLNADLVGGITCTGGSVTPRGSQMILDTGSTDGAARLVERGVMMARAIGGVTGYDFFGTGETVYPGFPNGCFFWSFTQKFSMILDHETAPPATAALDEDYFAGIGLNSPLAYNASGNVKYAAVGGVSNMNWVHWRLVCAGQSFGNLELIVARGDGTAPITRVAASPKIDVTYYPTVRYEVQHVPNVGVYGLVNGKVICRLEDPTLIPVTDMSLLAGSGSSEMGPVWFVQRPNVSGRSLRSNFNFGFPDMWSFPWPARGGYPDWDFPHA